MKSWERWHFGTSNLVLGLRMHRRTHFEDRSSELILSAVVNPSRLLGDQAQNSPEPSLVVLVSPQWSSPFPGLYDRIVPPVASGHLAPPLP